MENTHQNKAYQGQRRKKKSSGKVYREVYHPERIERLKSIISDFERQGSKKYYSILVDGETVVAKSFNANNFDNYKKYLLSNTQNIEVRMYFGTSPSSNRHIFQTAQTPLGGLNQEDVDEQIQKALAKQREAELDKKNRNKEVIADLQGKNINTPAPEQNNTPEPSNTIDKDTITLHGERLTERGFIFGSDSVHHIQEEFRHIKRKLINNAFGPASKTLKHSNLIMVSSSNPNEGKTFVSLNLAAAFAFDSGKTALLIDCNLRQPRLHSKLDLVPDIGLTDFLNDPVMDIASIIYPTGEHGAPLRIRSDSPCSSSNIHLLNFPRDGYFFLCWLSYPQV